MKMILFGSKNCPHCKTMEGLLKEIDCKYEKLDVTKEPEMVMKYGVMSIPNLFFLSQGKVLGQLIGVVGRAKVMELIEKFKTYED